MNNYHILYKEEYDSPYSKGVTIKAHNLSEALSEFDTKFWYAPIAIYCIEEVSKLLTLQRELGDMPTPPLRTEYSSPLNTPSNENNQNEKLQEKT